MARYFKCVTDKNPLSYKCGEIIKLEVYAREKCRNVECGCFDWELKTDDGKNESGKASCTANKPFVVETTLDKPGFVRITCKVLNAEGEVDTAYDVLDAGAGADVEKIEYHDTLPEDFVEYWADIEKLIDETEPEVLMMKEIENVQQGYKAYDMRVKTPEGRPASFVVTVPEGDGKYPVRATYMGYGVNPAYPLYTEGVITAYFNSHGVENCVDATELREKYKDEIGDSYAFNDAANNSKMTTYFRGMMIRDLMGLKYLKTMDKWDGENLVVSGGSQGGLQAVTVAAHSKGGTVLEIGAPWFCDLRGPQQGYMRGWRPSFAEGLRYFDTASHATFVKCPVKVTAGLGDYVCPPSGVMALYNGFKTAKTIDFTQAATHPYSPPERDVFTLNFDPENVNGELKKGKYRHFKGNEYEVIDIALDCETTEEVVVYKALYGEGKLWVRPKTDFMGYLCRDSKFIKRFEYIG